MEKCCHMNGLRVVIMTIYSKLDITNIKLKVCKQIYNNIFKNVTSTPVHLGLVVKWNKYFPRLDEDGLLQAFVRIYTMTSCCQLQFFQFKILHRILVTNEKLYMWNMVESDICVFCDEEIETLCHIFFECEVTKIFWKKVSDWIHDKCNVLLVLSPLDILLGLEGNEETNHTINKLYLIAKKYLYNTKCKHMFPSIEGFVSLVVNIKNI